MNHSIVPRPWRTCSPCLRSALAMMGLAVALAAGAQTPPALEEFAWRAPLTLPQAGAGQSASVVRLDLPVEALAQMQMRAGDDVRVFNQAGDAVPLVRLGAAPTAPAPPVRTPSYRAWEAGFDPASWLDRSINAARQAVFPLIGIDPLY